MPPLDIALFSRNQHLKRAVEGGLRELGLLFKLIDRSRLNDADLILMPRGASTLSELDLALLPRYRFKAIVLVQPADVWFRSYRPNALNRLQEQVQQLGYPYVMASKDTGELVDYAIDIIIAHFIHRG